MDLVYYGLASANGLESFFQDKSVNTMTRLGTRFGDMLFGEEENKDMDKDMRRTINMMCRSASVNSQRRSLVYRARVDQDNADMIEALKGTDPELALNYLKSEAKEIALASGVPMAKKFWDEIPNPKLDAFGSR